MSSDHEYCAANELFCGCMSCNDTHTSYWYHVDCGSKTCICYDELYVFCSGCDANAILLKWKFDCKDHGVQEASHLGLLFALSILGTTYGKDD